METTRHFTATTYVVHEGAVALHEHAKQELWLPPGGHVDRDELPHETAVREVREELGLDVDLLAPLGDVESETVEPLPQPQHFQLADVNITEQGVGHQHIDMVYYAKAPHRDLDPAEGEQPAADWEWFDAAALEADDRLPDDVATIGRRAIEAVADRDQ